MIVRIDKVGAELTLPEGTYRLVAAADLYGGHEALPIEEGALYHTKFTEEDTWEPEAVLRVTSPWLVHESGGRKRGIFAPLSVESRSPDERWLGLMQTDGDDESQPANGLLVPGGRIWQTERGWAGTTWSLEAHPCTRARCRPWTWVDGPSWPGTSLFIRHTRSTEAARAWLAGYAPLPYEQTSPDCFEDAFEESRRAQLTLFDGSIRFLRSTRSSDAVEAFEAGLLTDLARGALGPFTWDVVDEDWYAYVASGDDPSSLGDYLDPDRDEAPFRERRKALITPQPFDLRAAATPEALAQALAATLGAGHVESLDDFERWLAAQPVSLLPRSWALRVHPDLATTKMEWFTELFFRAQPRLRYSWTTA